MKKIDAEYLHLSDRGVELEWRPHRRGHEECPFRIELYIAASNNTDKNDARPSEEKIRNAKLNVLIGVRHALTQVIDELMEAI